VAALRDLATGSRITGVVRQTGFHVLDASGLGAVSVKAVVGTHLRFFGAVVCLQSGQVRGVLTGFILTRH
jgi:hypothetical protein